MNSVKALSYFALLLVGMAATVSCNKDAVTTTSDDKVEADGATKDAAAEESENDPFATMTEADRVAALAQKNCPVTDEALGSMGTPIKVTVEGRDVYVCCDGCVEELKSDPTKYLAKIDAASANPAQAAPSEASQGESADGKADVAG